MKEFTELMLYSLSKKSNLDASTDVMTEQSEHIYQKLDVKHE